MNAIIGYNEDEVKSFAKDTFTKYTSPRFKWVIEVNKWHEFYKANHFNYNQNFFNRPTNVGTISRIVPYSTVLIDNKRSQILSNDPIPVVGRNLYVDEGQDPDEVATAHEKLIEDVFDANNLPILSDDMVLNGCIDNAAFLQVNTSVTNSSGISLDMLDWHDVIMFPGIKHTNKSPILGKMFSGIIGEVREDPSYIEKATAKLKSQEKFKNEKFDKPERKNEPEAAIELKLEDFNGFQAVEWQTPIYVNDDVKKKIENIEVNGKKPYGWISEKKTGERIMRLFTISQDMVIRDQYLDYDRYNIFTYSPQSGPLYAQSIFSRLISANKSYDNLISQIELFMAYANKFRILVPQNTKMGDDFDNLTGQVQRFDGDPPVTPPQAQLPASVLQYVMKLEATMQFLVNYNASSNGQDIPGAKKAGAQKGQKQQDLFNTSPAIRRYNQFLTDVTKFILYIKANNTKMEDFSYMDAGKPKTKTIIGQSYKKHIMKNINPNNVPSDFVNKIQGATTISSDVPVKIKIAPGLDYREEAVAERVVALIKSGDLPKQALTLVFDDGKMAPIIKEANKEAAEEEKKQQAMQQQQQQQEVKIEEGQNVESDKRDTISKILLEIVKNPKIVPQLQQIGINISSLMSGGKNAVDSALSPSQQQGQQMPQQPNQQPAPSQGQPMGSNPAMPQSSQGLMGMGLQKPTPTNDIVDQLEKKAPFKVNRKKSKKKKKK